MRSKRRQSRKRNYCATTQMVAEEMAAEPVQETREEMVTVKIEEEEWPVEMSSSGDDFKWIGYSPRRKDYEVRDLWFNRIWSRFAM